MKIIKEFFPVNFIIGSNIYYCIWFCDGKDGLIVESGQVKSFSSIEALNVWNMIGDMANSLNISFYGNKRTKHIDMLYDKLFYGTNPPSLRGDREMYVPKFTKKEIRILRKVVKDGLRIVRHFLI